MWFFSPITRSVVIPARKIRRQFAAPRSADQASGSRSRRSFGSVQSKQRWSCASISPGSTVNARRSIVGTGTGPPPDRLETMAPIRPSST